MTRWCAHYGLDVVGPRRPPGGGHGVELDPKELRRLYVDDQWSARQIGDYVGVDAAIVTFALHSHRIPVRRGANGSRADAVVLLHSLYADPAVAAILKRYRVPCAAGPDGWRIGSRVRPRSMPALSTSCIGAWA